ncbi:carboxypeptidase-like regulatory domain-containing protein [Mucilaginibacter sp. Bleaf8]|uniref:carboxypeptidase-like regulatory domain-containing protein n=1 Tax=Mucilaginibacter sp. Bleaf8 TaxID=2834430 RepID=UPI001BD19FD1|nr:carboxypeptidase-like regulatory domain-containing protein [Mucilaginibacter sp. Bleaf8]MBS7563381.1 carboxypeptidase-like regulatory domain-containing protein [Mucilaginibacter sp. Bleaf8]
MRFQIVLLFTLLFTVTAWAQTGTITGKVVRLNTKTPMAGASVFLSNATFGTTTREDGTFTLTGVKPGQYELVVTSVGFEDFQQNILVGAQPLTITAEMMPRVTELHDVVITDGANWKRNYEMFVKSFLGSSANAKQCKILNPHDVNVIYRKSKDLLEASSYDFINIENKALGYQIKFLLKSFRVDGISNIISWEGKILYQELHGSAAQKKLWEQRRQNIYYGSSMHFFRSLISGRFSDDSFMMMRLLRKPNPKRANEEVIRTKLNYFRNINRDSMNYWANQANQSRYIEDLERQPLGVPDVVRRTDEPGLFAITFPNYLYVIYTKKREEMEFKDIYRPLDMPNYETSVITLYKPYALFDRNGIVISGQSTLFEGTWSKNKIAELLPVDYDPNEVK